MGVDTKLYIPAHVRARDVADVMGILLGQPHSMQELSRSAGNVSRVEGVFIKSVDVLPECCNIHVDGSPRREFLYHFEFSSPGEYEWTHGWHGITLPCWSSNIALFVAVAKFFGGCVDFNDCDEIYVDLEVKPEDSTWGFAGSPCDNAPWDAYQEVQEALQPLTEDELNAYEEYHG